MVGTLPVKLNFDFERENMTQKVLILRWFGGFFAGLVPGEIVITTF